MSDETEEIRKLRKLLADANRGAEINAHINNSLTAKLAKARGDLDFWRELYRIQENDLEQVRKERDVAREALIEAAKAVVERWDQPSWKDTEPTAGVIYRLRDAVERITGEVKK